MKSISVNKYLFVICLIFFLSLGIENNVNAERFFQSHSTWYEPIPPNPDITSNSANYVADIKTNKSSLYATAGDNPNAEWSVPIFHATGSSPIITVEVRGCPNMNESSTCIFWEANGWNDVPIPAGSVPAGNTNYCAGSYRDGHMVVISADGNTAYEFFGLRHCDGSSPADPNDPEDGTWKTSSLHRWDLTSDGINYPFDNHGTVRVATVPLLHGLVTYNEAITNTIDHALAFGYHGAESGGVGQGVYPHDGVSGGPNSRSWPLKVGMLLWLDVDDNYCPDLGLNLLKTRVCEALREYGMIFIENVGAGNNTIYMESLINQTDSWSGDYLFGTLSGLNISNFKVIEPLEPPFDNNSFDFSLANSGNLSMLQSASVTNTINASLISGDSTSVSYSVSGLPIDADASFSKTSCNLNCSSTLTISTSSSLPSGTYNITVTGTGGGISKSTNFNLIVSDGSDQNSQYNYTYIVTIDPEGTYLDAENFTDSITQGESALLLNSTISNFAGSGYLQTSGEIAWSCQNVVEGKEYQVNFTDTGLYNVWIRGYGADNSSDSVFIGIDGTCVGAINPNNIYNQWVWTSNIQSGTGINTIDITSPGIHTFNIWIREPNFIVDGIYLTQGLEFPPDDIALLDSIPPAPPVGLTIE